MCILNGGARPFGGGYSLNFWGGYSLTCDNKERKALVGSVPREGNKRANLRIGNHIEREHAEPGAPEPRAPAPLAVFSKTGNIQTAREATHTLADIENNWTSLGVEFTCTASAHL